MTGLSAPNWGFLLDELCQVNEVSHAIAVSGDGLVVASSKRLPKDLADRVAAITSGLASLTSGAASMMQAGPVEQTLVEMRDGFFVVMTIGDGSILTVLATKAADLGQIAFEMSELINRVGPTLTPGPRPF